MRIILMNIYIYKILVPTVVLKYLKDTYDIKGLFFVRQKRNPTLLAQAFTMPYDQEAQCPAIKAENIYIESFLNQPTPQPLRPSSLADF